MTQFSVYRFPNGSLALDLQSNSCRSGQHVVAPLVSLDEGEPALTKIDVALSIDGTDYVARVGQLLAVSERLLPSTPLQDVSDKDYEIRKALDFLFSGI